jgi:hypothetical protein
MITIHKYPVEIGDSSARMPQCAKILTCQIQAGVPCVWALVDTQQPRVDRLFDWHGTGHIIVPSTRPNTSYDGVYVATVQLEDGALVFHLFDLGER